MTRAWIATSAAALLAAAAFTISATEAGARSGNQGGHGFRGGGSGGASFRSGGPTVRSFNGGPTVRQFNGGPAVRQFNGGQTVRQFNGGAPQQYKFGGGTPPQFRNNGGKPHVVRHRHFRGPAVTFATPYVYSYGPDYYYAPDYYGYADNQCYEWQRVMTRQGWRYMWVNVCYD